MEDFAVPYPPLLVFLVVLARVGGLVTFAPFWAHRSVSPTVRVVLAAMLAIALTPAVLPRIGTPPTEVMPLVTVLFGELAIGMAMGFAGRIVFNALEVAAYLLASQMGFSLAGTIDPSTQAQTTAFGIAAQMIGLLVLLGMNGHHWFLAAAVKSFSTTAPGEFAVSAEVIDVLLRLSANALVVGITLAAPAIIVLLAVEFALEIFGRTAPQFQVFILGFPIKIAVGFWVVGSCVYFLPGAMRSVLGGIYDGLGKILGVM